MNTLLILSGGVGKRFGSDIPKQYHSLCGKPVIEYVIDYALKAKNVDRIVIVMDSCYMDYITERNNPKLSFAQNGKERADSIKNGLDYIEKNFGKCDKIVITQAVSPFVTDEIIDKYFSLLDDYDVVTTATKCPGELFNKEHFERINRNNYYFCQSPEAFHFIDLKNNLKIDSEYSEIIYHYSFDPKVCYYLDMLDNVKLTYLSDLKYAEFLLKERNNKTE